MSVRIRVILITTATVIGITLAQFGISFLSIQSRLSDAENGELAAICGMANELINAELLNLHQDAMLMARFIPADDDYKNTEAITQYFKKWIETPESDFIAITLFDKNGVVYSVGKPDASPLAVNEDKYLQQAFGGQITFTTTSTDEQTGELVFYELLPLNDTYVIAATIRGTYFYEKFRDFRIHADGRFFVLDGDSYTIVNSRKDIVTDRVHFASLDRMNGTTGANDLFEEMFQGDNGIGQFTYNHQERKCAWMKVTSDTVDWIIAITMPVSEMPSVKAHAGLLTSGFLFLIVCIAVGTAIAFYMTRPYSILETQNRKMSALNEEVQAANEAKSVFLANMSHEMRTPLNAIIGFSELALSSDAEQKEVIPSFEKIHSAGRTLLNIINDILDIAKIESGKFEILPVEYDLPSLINDVITINIFRIRSKPVKFLLEIDENLPAVMLGDDLRIKQICNNLLSNAFKYTDEGTVTWSISFEKNASEANSIWLKLSVRDTGIGIKPGDIEKLFLDYNQLDLRKNRKIEGTGLGLSLTKRMIDLMDGTITVESDFGKGSVFCARIRQVVLTDKPIGEKVAHALCTHNYTDSKRNKNERIIRIKMPYARVLVVDDNQSNLDIAKGILKPYNVNIDCVKSGQEAVYLIAVGNPVYNAVFMDHMMPGMDGIEATRLIREMNLPYTKNLPIIALTANAITGNEEMFLENGFNAFLTKPIDIMRLDSIMRQFVRNKELETTSNTAQADAAKSDTINFNLFIAGIDTNRGLESFGNDISSYMTVLESFSKNNALVLEKLNCLGADDMAEYAVDVHGIKGSSRGICAYELGEAAEGLEYAAKAGDREYIRLNHDNFIEMANTLIKSINGALSDWHNTLSLPLKDSLETSLLIKIQEACENFDIDGVDICLRELSKYEYKDSDAQLLTWLKEQASISGFEQIAERLKAYLHEENL